MFLSESTRFYRSRPRSIWPQGRTKRSDLIEDNSSKTQPGEFGRCAQGQKVIFSGDLGIFVVNSPMLWPVLVEYVENLFCHLWRNFSLPLIFHPAGELPTPPSGQLAPSAGCGGHGHTQQLPSHQQAHGRIFSLRRICSNLSKNPGQLSTGYESASYEKHVLRNCGSAVFTRMEH